MPISCNHNVMTQCMRTMYYWGPTDRSTDRPTPHFGTFQTAISRQRVIRFTSCLVLGRVFEVGGSNGAISGCTKSKMVAGRHLGNPRWRLVAALENFKWPYLWTGCPIDFVFDPIGRVFGEGGSNGAISGFTESNMAASCHLEKFRMTISLEWVIRSTFMNYRAAWRNSL